jgi:CRP/FNR family transcriptional regulator/CRP/FNR family cyclic AMP-dependent transcriptional regulator
MLEHGSFFSCFKEKDLKVITAGCAEKSVVKGAVILYQGEESSTLYFIVDGKVKVSLTNEEGKEVILDILGQGDFFGEMSCLDSQYCSAMVSALTDVRILYLEKEAFLAMIASNPEMMISLLSEMSGRLRRANRMIETLAFLDVAGRISRMLIELAREKGELLEDGSVMIVPPTHQEMASQIGSSREAVTKALKSLTENRLIIHNGKQIILPPQYPA